MIALRAAPRAGVLAVLEVAVASGCVASAPSHLTEKASHLPEKAPSPTPARDVLSNVDRSDYAGSPACRPCHADVFAAWERSPMHRMTRDGTTDEVRAPFDGTRWQFQRDAVVLEQRGAARFLRVEPAGGEPKVYRVTRVIGGRTREDFAGVDDRGMTEEVVLPVSYVFATHSLRYKGYSVMLHERRSLRAGPLWARACIFCHNTVPELDRLLGAIAGPSAHAYQGEQVDRWLPSDRRMSVRVTDERWFASTAAEEVAHLGGALVSEGSTPHAVAERSLQVVRSAFKGSSLIEVGIGCEACHGGARAHALDPRIRPSLAPKAPWLDARLPKATRAAEINRVCARCHQVLFSRYPFTWEGGRRDVAAGGSHINSGEARDFLLGHCSSALACTACHDPHGGASAGAVRSPESLSLPSGNDVCTPCHVELALRDRLRAHAHHDPDGRGGSCIACHMARKNMGLDGVLTRYHRIGSPTDPERVLGDRPLECALCHADKAVRSLVDAMESWWPVRYPRQRLEELYGSLDVNVMRATLERGKPHEQAVAIATLGEVRSQSDVPLIAERLLSEYPLVREWAKRALVSIRGRCDVDLSADDNAIAQEAARCGLGAITPRAGGATPTGEEPED